MCAMYHRLLATYCVKKEQNKTEKTKEHKMFYKLQPEYSETQAH